VNTSTVSDANPHLVIVTGSRRQQKDFVTRVREAVEQDVRNLRMGVTDAIQSGINRGNNALSLRISGPRADGTYSPRDIYLINAKLHASTSNLSALDAVTLFGKNGTVGGAAFDAFQNRSALGVLGVAAEVFPLLRVVPSQTVSKIVTKAEFSVPAKALDIIPEGPFVKLSPGSNTNVIGPSGVNGPNPFTGADTSFTVAGGVNLQLSVPTARGGSGALETAATRTNFNVYEALSQQSITGSARASHRASANQAFYSELKANPDLAKYFNSELGTDVMAHMTSGNGRALLNPPNAVWHHPAETPGVMQLLRKTEHTNLRLQPVLHPEGIGGFGNFYGN
jgi:hypothetical protein